jgi:hypothetical protein
MKLWRLALPAVAFLSACSGTADYYGEEFSMYYKAPAEDTTVERLEGREILTWKADPRKKKRLGYLYKYETKVAGSRGSRESYTIYDVPGKRALGFITAEGVVYRYDELGRMGSRVGEYPILPVGLKVFFGIPVEDNLDLEEIDPYR